MSRVPGGRAMKRAVAIEGELTLNPVSRRLLYRIGGFADETLAPRQWT